MAKKTQKTHKGVKKVLNIRNSGSITIGKPGSRHNTGHKNTKFSRRCRKGSDLNKSDAKRLQKIIEVIK